MKNLLLMLIAIGVFDCSGNKELTIQKYGNGQRKVTYEILRGTEEEPIDVKYKAYYENGVLMKEGLLIKMKEDGEWKYYFNSGRVSSVGNYSNGVRTGEFTRYYESGEIEQHGQYVDGEIRSTTFYYRDGKVKNEPIDVTAFILNSQTLWTPSQLHHVTARCNQQLQFDYSNSIEFCRCLVDSTSKYVEFHVIDTLSDYDRSLIYQVFMQKGACAGLLH